MSGKELDFQDLIEEAIRNAREDRGRAKEAYEKMKDVFDIDTEDSSSLQAAMFVGAQAVKLIETIADSNEQVLKAAALKQKEKPKVVEEDQDGPMDIDDLRKKLANQG